MQYKAMKTRLKLSKKEQLFLRLLTRSAKNLYNCALYNVRQAYHHENHRYLDYHENYELLKNSNHYKTLNSSIAQAVIRKVDESMKAFFGSVKSSKVKKVRLPRYLPKDGFYPLIDRVVYKPTNEHYVLPRSNFIKRISNMMKENKKKEDQLLDSLSFENIFRDLNIVIETPKSITNHKIKEITIKPKFDGRYFEVIHVYEIEDVLDVTDNLKTETMGIDFGYVNLATCAVTNGHHLLLDGNKLKSYNQWYHKRMAYLQSTRTLPKSRIIEIQKENDEKETKRQKKIVLPYTRQMARLEMKRTNRMSYGINKAARLIINHAITNHVGHIIIGWNEGFKELGKSKDNNQWFKCIPLAKLRDRIEYLANQYEIECEITTEEYTSKASYFDGDIIPSIKSNTELSFSGKRIMRGLYVTKEGKKINADVNAALNILRKGNPNAARLGLSGANTPKRTFLFV